MPEKKSFDPTDAEGNKRLLELICQWLENNLEHHIGWAALSEQFELSQEELQNLFNEYKKTTPMNYIHELRENKKKAYFIDKNRISPIFIQPDS
jgi:AraC-like DNA-binding protein